MDIKVFAIILIYALFLLILPVIRNHIKTLSTQVDLLTERVTQLEDSLAQHYKTSPLPQKIDPLKEMYRSFDEEVK